MNGLLRSLLALLLWAGWTTSVAAQEWGSAFPTATTGPPIAVDGWPDLTSASILSEAVQDCGQCGPGSICPCGKTPFITATIDAIWLDRSGADAQNVLFDGGGAPLLNVTELDLGVEAGVSVDVILYHELGYDVQFGYSGVSEWTSLEERTAMGATYLFFGGSPLAPVDTYAVEYRSKMSSGELNGRWRPHHQFAILAGARIVDLQEVFNVLTTPTTGVFSHVDNDLYGVQVGGEGILWTNGYARYEASVRAGLFHNSVNVFAEATDGGGMPVTVAADGDRTASLVEVISGFVIPIWPGELRIGVRGLWIQNIILAPDQSDSLSFFAPGSIDFGNVSYYGGYVGWEGTW